MRTPGNEARIAIVHPLVESIRGGEKVFFEMARALPSADLFTLHYRPGILPPDIDARLSATFLQWPAVRRAPFRAFLPMLPRAVASLPTASYDVVLSSSSGWAHGAPTGDGVPHICYMHTPPRYLWHEAPPNRFGRLTQPLLDPLLGRLRKWDRAAAARVTTFLANSETTRTRIAERYGRESEVLHPPIDVDRWLELDLPRGDYVLAAGELVPYKRFDLAIDACARAKVPLIVIGDGPQRALLDRQAAGTGVRFLGRVDDPTFEDVLGRARLFLHPGIEDFGMTTVEALAAGIPVVGARQGGTGEIVVDGTGELVTEPDAGAFADAITRALATTFDRDRLRARARDYGLDRFRQRILDEVETAL